MQSYAAGRSDKPMNSEGISGEHILRVALYPRVSTEEQAIHGYSLGAQEAQLVSFAKEHGYKIVGIYRDEGYSARKPAMKRKVIQSLIADVRAGKIDRILFIKLDRWFRNVREYHKIQAILEENHVTWQATMEDYNTSTADGRLKVNIMLSVAENESDRTSERIKFVLDAKRKNKLFCFSGKKKPYGYTAGIVDGQKRCVKDPETEPIVTDFFDHLSKYHSVRQASLFVNEKYGFQRHYRSWMCTARNELYTGTYFGVEDYCEPYIDRKTWEYVMQSHMLVKKTQRPERVYLFTSLLRCPECGNTLKGTFKTYPNDRMKEYRGYRCNNGKLRTCPYHGYISENKLEKYLLAHIKTDLERYITENEVANSEKRKSQQKTLDAVKINEQIRRLNAVYIAGNISDEDYAEEAKKLKATLEKAKQQEKEEAPVDLNGLKDFLEGNFLELYKSMAAEDKRRMWRSIIDSIHPNGDGTYKIAFRS